MGSAFARARKGALLILISTAVTLTVPACQAEKRGSSMSRQVFEPELFSSVEVNVEGRASCSPSPPADPSWVGILIKAPASVKTLDDAPAVVPVCVFAVLPIIVPDPPPMTLVAIDRDTGARYQGPAFTRPPPPDDAVPDPTPSRPRTPQEVAGFFGSSRFTTDLVSAVDLPAGSGLYDIHIERGEFASEPVTIRIEAP